MWRYRPSYVVPDRPVGSPIVVSTPTGKRLKVFAAELAAELGDHVQVIKQGRGVFDSMPLQLIIQQTVTSLGALVGRDLDVSGCGRTWS